MAELYLSSLAYNEKGNEVTLELRHAEVEGQEFRGLFSCHILIGTFQFEGADDKLSLYGQ